MTEKKQDEKQYTTGPAWENLLQPFVSAGWLREVDPPPPPTFIQKVTARAEWLLFNIVYWTLFLIFIPVAIIGAAFVKVIHDCFERIIYLIDD